VPVYPYKLYLLIVGGQSNLVRDFLTFPPFTALAAAYFLSRKRMSFWVLIAIIVIIVGVFASFTRSWIIPYSICLVIAALYRVGNSRNGLRGILGLVAIVLMGVISIAFLSSISPRAFEYVGSRFMNLQTSDIMNSSLGYRLDLVAAVNTVIAKTNPILGSGYVPYTQVDPTGLFFQTTRILGDIMWSKVLLYYGWAGVLVYALLLLFGLIQSFRLASSEHSIQSGNAWGLFFLLYFVIATTTSFTGTGFLDDGIVAALPFALLSIASRRAWMVYQSSNAYTPMSISSISDRPTVLNSQSYMRDYVEPR
jgi:hypothetical protein